MQKRANSARLIQGFIFWITALLVAIAGSNDACDMDDGHMSCDATTVRIDAAMVLGHKPYPVRRRSLNGQSIGFGCGL